MVDGIFWGVGSGTFWRWRARSPAERSECSASERLYSRKMLSSGGILECHPERSEGSARSDFPCSNQNDNRQSPPPSYRRRQRETLRRINVTSLLPHIVRRALEHHLQARFSVARLQQGTH